jgi:hypothetical protein
MLSLFAPVELRGSGVAEPLRSLPAPPLGARWALRSVASYRMGAVRRTLAMRLVHYCRPSRSEPFLVSGATFF